MQAWLKQLQENLELAGIKTFFDLRDMQGNLDATMRINLEASDFVISVLTPRFLTRAEDPKTNLAFEFNLTLEKTKANPGAILPILYSGQFQDVVKGPLAGLAKHLIYTIQANTRIEPHLVELSPLGLIPVIYDIRGGDPDYTRLLTPWRHSYLTRLPQPLPNAIERRGLRAELFHPLEAKESVSVQVIHGAEGMGKTQLANQYVHQIVANYPGFVRWLFADPSNLSAEWLRLGELLGLELTGLSEARQCQQIRIALQKQERFLIVLDGIENEAALKDLLPEQLSPTQQILITTRSHAWHYPKLVVPPFTADETQAFFTAQHLSAVQRKGEHELAEALGFHPQALATAVAGITSTGKSARDYCQEKGLLLAASGDSHRPPAHAPQSAAAFFQPQQAAVQSAANAQQIAALEAQLENLEKTREGRLAETAYKKLPALKNLEELNKRIKKFKADREECEESGDEFPKDKSTHLQLCIKLAKELPDMDKNIQSIQKEIRKLKGGSQANEISIEHGALDISGADIDAAGSVRAGHEDNINLDGGGVVA